MNDLLGWFLQQPYARISSRRMSNTALKVEFECHDKNGIARSAYVIIQPNEEILMLARPAHLGSAFRKRLQEFRDSLEEME